MQRNGTFTKDYCRSTFSLRDLRTSKGITQKQLADVLKISKSLYHAIENGQRKPSIDVVYVLALIYKTSMELIYHAYYRQHFIWHFPDDSLQYSLREAMDIDIQFLRDRIGPEALPHVPDSVIWKKDQKNISTNYKHFKPYGLEQPTITEVAADPADPWES